MPSARARTHAGTAVWAAPLRLAIKAIHATPPSIIAMQSGNESPEGSQGAHEREENGCERDDGVDRETALHARQEGGADDSAEAEAGEQKTVAQGTEAEVPARDHRQQGPERAGTHDEDAGSNQHGGERRGVAR